MRRIGLIGAAVALLMLGNAAGVFAQQNQDDRDKKHGKQQEKKEAQEAKKLDKQSQRNEEAQQRVQRDQQAQQAQRDQQAQQNQNNQQQLRLSQQQQQRVAEQQQRASQYQRNQDEQLRLAQAHAAQLEQQNRRSQILIQQQYAERLRQQQLQSNRNYDYGRDPYFNTPMNYRYNVGGRRHQTNRYGADVLRQAVNYGYQEGLRAGEADKNDRWGFKYQESFAYRDANYGYAGRYVEQGDYNYYFREGFRRGYEDGYYRRARYGRQSNGNATVLSIVMSGILRFDVIR